MVFRLLTLGVCVACVVFVATFDPGHREMVPLAAPPPAVAAEPPLRVVDIAAQVAPSEIFRMLGLGRHEWIKAINDRETPDEYEAREMLEALAQRGAYLDLTIAGDAPDRRVLVLIH